MCREAECRDPKPRRRGAVGTVVVALLALLFPALPAAAEGPYTVAKLAVDVTAKNAVAAKEQGIAEAERRALDIVLRRLVPFDALAQLPAIEPADAGSLVKDFTIRSEKYSTTRYIASFDITFEDAAINQLLASRAIPLATSQSPGITILPIVLNGDKVGSVGEAWRQAWLDLDLANGTIRATILQPRPELTADAVRGVLAGDAGAYAAVQSTYSDQPLVIAVGQTMGGQFVLRLAGADGVGPVNYGRSTPMPAEGKNAAAQENAAFALALLEDRWKAINSDGDAAPAALPGGQQTQGAAAPEASLQQPQGEAERNVVALVQFSGLKEWQDIRGRLMQVPGVQALEVNSLSPRMASITFDYAGSLGKLQEVLGSSGFSFENGDENFVIRAR